MSVVIDANRVTKVFHHLLPRCGSTRVLTDVSFSLHSGEILAVIGPSGAGKTTLVRAVLDQFPLSGGYIHRFGGGRAP
ncbi:MAG: ATP-binding cassette domain-containing protein, partial [Bacteroidota bacterium]